MFDEEDSDDEDEEKDQEYDDGKPNLDYRLQNPGDEDGPLTYGIQFIQNALKSWAQQRLTAQYAQHYHQMEQQRCNEMQPPKRGPGRPRKFDNGEDDPRPMPPPPTTIQMDLSNTPEGAAVAAFQEVLDSGCLVVNTVLPIELTRALRTLYMQIDHLINQGSRNEQPWQCMSYGAQIQANKTRVEKCEEAQARVQEEMAKQQLIAQQTMMQQMSIPQQQHQQQRGPITVEQAQQAHAMELERRRGLQHAAQQPHLTKSLTNPLLLNSQPQGTPSGYAPSPSPVNGASAGLPGGVANGPPKLPNGLPSASSPAGGKGVALDKIKLYWPNYLPRSGQSMKFSFAPTNELAIKAFGAQAFPTPHAPGPNLPNRGPMSASPAVNAPQMPNGTVSTPVLGSNAPSPAPPQPSRANSDTIHVTLKRDLRYASQTAAGNVTSFVTNGTTTPKENEASKFGAFRPLNPPNAHQRSSSMSVDPSHAASPPRPSIEIPNNTRPSTPASASPSALRSSTATVNKLTDEFKGSSLDSRFPHPGAVVVDQ